MRQRNLENRDIFWLWWVLAPQLGFDDTEIRHACDVGKSKYQVVSLTRKHHGGFETEEDMSGSDAAIAKRNRSPKLDIVETRHYHIQRGHWYSSIPMVLLVILIIVLIPIAAVVAFTIVISLFVNQSLFTMLADLGCF